MVSMAARGIAVAERPARSVHPAREVVLRLQRNNGAVAGAVVLLLMVALALAAPLVSPYSPTRPAGARLSPPSSAFWFGTDTLGRDILSRVIFGARISLQLGLISVGIAAAAGTIMGLFAGYYGRLVDTVIMRFVDMLLAFPRILLALVVAFSLGPSLGNVMIAVGISGIPPYARVVRGSVLSARENVYVEAARVVGCGDPYIMFRHILPNVFAPVIVLSTLGLAWAILTAASLGFLGLGAPPPTPEWGAMLSDGRGYLRQAWWITTFPGVAIMATVLAINLLGDGLRDALDPRLKGS